MKAFDHYTPTTLPEALALLGRLDGQARVIAGGTDLMLKMKAGAATPAAVVNIKRLPELKGIKHLVVESPTNPPTHQNIGLRIGALTTLRELTRSPLIQERYPVLAEAAGVMASEQIRSFATVGGNLCNAAPSADLAPPLIALEATVRLAGPGGDRHLPLEAFFLGPGRSALEADELLREIILPPPEERVLYFKQAPRAYMDIAVVGVAVSLHLVNGLCQRVRIALGAVAPVPLRVRQVEPELTGQPLTADRIERAASLAATACSPIDDVRGSAWYRRRMVQVLARRALQQLVA